MLVKGNDLASFVTSSPKVQINREVDECLIISNEVRKISFFEVDTSFILILIETFIEAD